MKFMERVAMFEETVYILLKALNSNDAEYRDIMIDNYEAALEEIALCYAEKCFDKRFGDVIFWIDFIFVMHVAAFRVLRTTVKGDLE